MKRQTIEEYVREMLNRKGKDVSKVSAMQHLRKVSGSAESAG